MSEPVAWMSPDGKVSDTEGKLFYIPLYTHQSCKHGVDDGACKECYQEVTHPAKELKNIVVASATCSCGKVMEVTNLQPVKELTDFEIMQISSTYPDRLYFARAILRKAQEK